MFSNEMLSRLKLGNVFRVAEKQTLAELRCGIVSSATGTEEYGFRTPQYAVVYVIKGTGYYSDAEHGRFPLGPGTLFQRFPNRLHDAVLQGETWRCYMAVPAQVHDMMRAQSWPEADLPVLQIGRHDSIVLGFQTILDELRSLPRCEFMRTVVHMQQFLLDLHERGRTRAPGAPSGDEFIAAARELLSQNLSRRILLPEVAQKLNVSYSLFRKRFTAETGISPGEYRIRRRIERAMELLSHSGASLQTVAEQLGYPDVHAFSAQFKKTTAVAPSEFKREHAL